MKTIVTIQHTQSVHHTNGMVGSWTDWDLTEKGVTQAKTIAKNLAKQFGDQEWVIYSSDLKRAKQTAEPIAEAFQTEIVFRKELRERNLGQACGKSVDWLHENQQMEEMSIDDRLFEDAESKREEWNRLIPFFDDLIDTEAENIMVVSHGDLLNAFVAMFLGQDAEILNYAEFRGMAGSVSVLQFTDDGMRRVKTFADMSYLME